MKKITLFLIFSAFALFSTVLIGQTEPPDFPNTGLGPIFELQAGTNTFSGSVTSPLQLMAKTDFKLNWVANNPSLASMVNLPPTVAQVGFGSV